MLKDNAKLYCDFIDYEKTFDTVIRDALWFKLTDNGISSKLTRMLRFLYHKVLAAVKMQSDGSSFFQIALGVKQCEPLSPLLFILFVNDIYSDLTVVDEFSEVACISINQLIRFASFFFFFFFFFFSFFFLPMIW